MKVLLTGCTGFIGGEVLDRCIAHPSVTSILTMTRRALPAKLASNPKVSSIILQDFANYSEDTIHQFEDVDACIWALGKASSVPGVKPYDVDVGFTMACAEALEKATASRLRSRGQRLRFIYVSGILSVRDQETSLWFMGDGRRSRGEAETRLLSLAEGHAETFQGVVVRPGGVLKRSAVVTHALLAPWTLRVDELAATLVQVALDGVQGHGATLETGELRSRGARLVAAEKRPAVKA